MQTFHDEDNKDQAMFVVPKNTKIFNYNPKEDPEVKASQRQMQKMQVREELVRGYRVQPEYICHPGECCVDLPDYNQLFNGQMMG